MSDSTLIRPHQLIRASAGSGKTYRLVRRLIGLLADAEAPESILAATFSRKAAGEFRKKLLQAVAGAVTDSRKATDLAAEIEHPEWNSSDFQNLLAQLVRDPDSLRLSTIDAFFFELVGLFRFELGLGTQITLGDETADSFDMRDLLRRIFASATEEVRQAIFHLIEEDRSSESVRSFQTVLEEWISKALDLYRSTPDGRCWGILPSGVQLEKVTGEEWALRLGRLEDALAHQTIPPESADSIRQLLEDLSQWDLSPTLSGEPQKWIKAGAKDAEKLAAGKKYFVINRKRVTLEPETGEALIELARLFHSNSVSVAVSNTRGAHQFIEMFAKEYDKRRLRSGFIRFGDLPYLLTALETVEGAMLAYRLDARIKHWLLDEFQDTSRSQWQVVHPLIDELFFDAEENRSFFCVGDPKQAIYGWRQGDSRLFEEIRERYQDFEPRPLETTSIAKTYRCAPEIISFTNKLFGSPDSFPEDLSPRVVERWLATWRTHESARTDATGHVQVHTAADSDARDEEVVDYLLENKPWRYDQSIAILCRGNKAANRFESLLRSRGIPTIRDGALMISNDFITGRLLHAYFQVLLHPGDTMALSVLRCSSAADSIRRFCGSEITPESIRRQWEALTLTEFISRFEMALAEENWIDDSERRCLRTIFNLLDQIENSSLPALREIVQTLQHARLEDTGSNGSVQVLTIHRSKGLEFDIVILPDLDKDSSNNRGKRFWTHDHNGRIDRILESVNADTRLAFPALDEWGESEEEDATFENLCVHYVAFTRAINSLHVFLERGKGKSKTGIHRWLQQAYSLESLEETGLEIGEVPTPPPLPEPPPRSPRIEPPRILQPKRSSSRRLLTPSSGDDHLVGSPFSPGRNTRLTFGRRVHEALASWEWPATEWNEEKLDSEVSNLLRAAFESEAICSLLKKPSEEIAVWRERSFDALIDNTWSSGVFDRVHLSGDWMNGSGGATLIDYKTDTGFTGEVPPGYRQQMTIYRSALSRILALDESRISAKLVFLRHGKVVDL